MKKITFLILISISFLSACSRKLTDEEILRAATVLGEATSLVSDIVADK